MQHPQTQTQAPRCLLKPSRHWAWCFRATSTERHEADQKGHTAMAKRGPGCACTRTSHTDGGTAVTGKGRQAPVLRCGLSGREALPPPTDRRKQSGRAKLRERLPAARWATWRTRRPTPSGSVEQHVLTFPEPNPS